MMHHHQSSYVQQYQQQLIQSHPQQLHHMQHQQTQPLQQHNKMIKKIAPAPALIDRSSIISNIEQNRVSSTSKKTKMTYAHIAYATTQPASVQRRNARERNRVKQVNNGFANLRQHIPSDVISTLTNGGRGASKKLSKVDTLRLAVEYIRRLQDVLDENDIDSSSTASSSRTASSSLSVTNSYYTASPVQCTSIPPPPCSESSASPTPSYSSDNSIGNNNHNNSSHYATSTPFKYEVFDAYNPEEEELLDAISWWQQQQ